jgi:sugar/nucleoside kinase (ribokinase family)
MLDVPRMNDKSKRVTTVCVDSKPGPRKSQVAAPVSIGSGLIALDWLLIGKDRIRPNETYAGGSCGNVMTILAYLGWQSYPVARLGLDAQANRLMADLKRWNVHTDFMLREEHGVTPVIIVRLREKEDGTVTRRYEWRHPASGEWLPRYRPVPKKIVAELLSRDLPLAKVFYFDRTEPSSLLLATFMREQGAVVFFEPSSARNKHLLSDCLAVSDIVKYSAERLSEPPHNPISQSPRLEIQTLGEAGLRYRLKLNSTTPGPWRRLPSYPVLKMRDTTGCGDWCSAGLISALCRAGRKEFLVLEEDAVVEGLQFGQGLAAINCSFNGARGPMYNLSAGRIVKVAQMLLKKHHYGTNSRV